MYTIELIYDFLTTDIYKDTKYTEEHLLDLLMWSVASADKSLKRMIIRRVS